MDTIFALASGRGKAGVAVIRISGPAADATLTRLSGRFPDPRHAMLAVLRDGQGVELDEALVLRFADRASFTGEPVVELHLHGSRAVVAAVLRTLSEMPGLRQAEPGEFTRRALTNGRLDLTEVEGLADLIDAETEAQRRQALRLLSGALGKRADRWRAALIRAMALLEATIDFADEEVPVDVRPEVLELIGTAREEMTRELAGQKAAERIRDGFEIAILGAPNIGKSTLLNALAGRDAALTSDVAGTTRDVIEVRMDLGGLPVTFLDTAGLRATEDRVEAMGIERALARAENADLRVILVEPGAAPPVTLRPDDIVLAGKSDLHDAGADGVSGLTGSGIDRLLVRIDEVLQSRSALAGTSVSERHRVAMSQSVEALDKALAEVAGGPDRSEFAAEHLRDAVRRLDSLVGRVDVEHILDEIFRSFCLGK